jgi:hypothetical protein
MKIPVDRPLLADNGRWTANAMTGRYSPIGASHLLTRERH